MGLRPGFSAQAELATLVFERIVGGIPWAIGSFLGPRAITFASTVVLARFLLPAEFGTFAVGLLVFIGAATLSELGIGAVMVSSSSLDARTERAALATTVSAGTAMALLIGGFCLTLAETAGGGSDVPWVVAAFAAAVPLHMVGSFHDHLLQRDLHFNRRFVAQNVQAAAFPLVAIPLAVADAGVWALVAGHITGTVLFTFTALRLSRSVRPVLDRARAAAVVRDGVGFLAEGFSDFIKVNVDYISVGHWRGVTQLGFYSMAWRFAELPYLAVTEPVSRVMFASMGHLRDTPTGVRDTYRGLLRFVGMLGCPIGVVFVVASDPFVLLVLGETWAPAAGVLAILGFRSVLLPLNGMALWLLSGAGHSRRMGAVSGSLLVPFAVAVVLAAVFGGIETVAYVLLVDAVVWSVLIVTLASRLGVVSVREHLSVLGPLAVATAAAAGTSWGALRLVDTASPFVQTAVAAGSAVVTFLTVFLVIDRDGVRTSADLARGRAGALGEVPPKDVPTA